MSQRLLVQSALRGAQGIEHKNRDIDLKALAILSYTKKAAVHGACGGAQARAAGVLKGLAGFKQGLLAHYAQALDLFGVAIGVVDIPGAGDQLGRCVTSVGNGDGIGKHILVLVRGGLVGQELR